MEKENILQRVERAKYLMDKVKKKFSGWNIIPECLLKTHHTLLTHAVDSHVDILDKIEKWILIDSLLVYAAREHSRRDVMEIINVIFDKEN